MSNGLPDPTRVTLTDPSRVAAPPDTVTAKSAPKIRERGTAGGDRDSVASGLRRYLPGSSSSSLSAGTRAVVLTETTDISGTWIVTGVEKAPRLVVIVGIGRLSCDHVARTSTLTS